MVTEPEWVGGRGSRLSYYLVVFPGGLQQIDDAVEAI